MKNLLCFKHLFLFSGLLLLSVSGVLAQSLTFKQADGLTYDQYLEGNWKELVKIGEQAQKEGYDFFYLNLRMGVAYFYLNDFYKAVKYLKKAHKQDSSNEIVNDLLHWTLVNTGEDFAANEFKPIAANGVKVQTGQKLDYIFTEGGMKLSSKPDTSGNQLYFNLGAQHTVSPDLRLYYAFTHLDQKNNFWGGFGQNQFYVNASVNLHKGWILTLGEHVSFFNSNLSYLVFHDSVFIPPPAQPSQPGANVYDTTRIINKRTEGNFGETSSLFYLALSRTTGRWCFTPSLGLYLASEAPNYNVVRKEHLIVRTLNKGTTAGVPRVLDTNSSNYVHDSIVNTKSMTWVANPAFAITFVPKLFHDRLVMSGKLIIPVMAAGPGKPVFSPEIKCFLGKKIMISASYFYKGPEIIADKSGLALYNNYDVIHALYSFSCMYKISRKISTYATYQYQDLTGATLSDRYKFNSVIISLKLNL